MMGMRETTIAEDPYPTMEDIFGHLHLEGHQINTASPQATKGERVEQEVIATEEFTIDRG